MKASKYMETQNQLINIGRALDTLDLDGFLRSISKAEALAPMLDPTMYRKAQANLQGLKRLAESLRPAQTAFAELRGAVLETAVLGFMEKQPKEPEHGK